MCDSCNVISINGMNCHETGCPDSWRDYEGECVECGQSFTPEYKGQKFCSEECNMLYV